MRITPELICSLVATPTNTPCDMVDLESKRNPSNARVVIPDLRSLHKDLTPTSTTFRDIVAMQHGPCDRDRFLALTIGSGDFELVA